jgi:prepilin-type N-terminal cleavage/methylation domain-containing protein
LNTRSLKGFTLVEVAVVVLIVGLLMAGAIYTLQAQIDQRAYEETRSRLTQARDLLLAYAIVNGRLPCPARITAAGVGTGVEVRDAAGECKSGAGVEDHYGGPLAGGGTGGFLPGTTIGFMQTDAAGFALDAYNNRIRYAVAKTVTGCAGTSTLPHFVRADRLKGNGITCQPNDLLVCKSSAGVTATTCGGAANQVMAANLVVAVVFSTGKTGAIGTLGPDEAVNQNGTAVLVFHTPSPTFDDQMTWITAGELYGKLIAAGVLP